MSNKTSFKRLALVVVSALGFGLLSAVNAPLANATSGSFVLSASSITVVSANASNVSNDTVADADAMNAAILRITVKDDGATAPSAALVAGESITASVVAVPTTVSAKTLANNASDITFQELKMVGTTSNGEPIYEADTPTAGGNSTTDGQIGSTNTAQSDSSTSSTVGDANSVYTLAIMGDTVLARDQGEYTIRIRLTGTDGFVLQDSTVKVNFVSTAASSGAKITITTTGALYKDKAYTYTTDDNTRVNLTDANGGRIQFYATTGATAYSPTAPALSVDLVDEDGLSKTNGNTTTVAGVVPLAVVDNGVATQDHVASSSTVARVVTNVTDRAAFDGNYGIITNDSNAFDTATAGTTNQWRIRYGATQTLAAVTLYAVESATHTDSTVSVTADGAITGVNNTGKMNVSNDWTLPLTTKTAKITVRALNGSTAVQDYPISFTTDWNSSVASGDISPADLKTTVVRTDSSGFASLTVTNNAAIDGAVVTISVAGLTGSEATQTIRWEKSKPAAVTIDPIGNYKAVTKSTIATTWTFTDTFGAPVVGELVKLSISGANSATSTVTIPSVTTDANGQVKYTFTDAAGVEASTTLGTTTVTATATTVAITGSRTITWVATLPVPASLSGYYNEDETAGTYPDLVPTTTIYDTASTADEFNIDTTVNLTRSLVSASDQGEQVGFEYTVKDSAGAAISGVPVTVSVSNGLHILSSAGLPVTSRTLYPSATGKVSFKVIATLVGTHTITVTAGSVTATAKIAYENQTSDARYLTITGDTTGTANAAKLPLATAKVTDRWGNPVAGVTINASHVGVGRLSSGGKTQQFTTLADGSYVFELTSTDAGSATVTVTATNPNSGQMADIAGYVGATQLVDAITAGNTTATHSVTFAAGTDPAAAAAEAASDAALEAIDAANAATDAANLAAEAADAATVAAEEARDAADAATAAVEALASEVATLIAGLKAQITTLANTVAKIAKRVRA